MQTIKLFLQTEIKGGRGTGEGGGGGGETNYYRSECWALIICELE